MQENKIKNLVIINKYNKKEYKDINLDLEEIIERLKNNIKNKNNIKRVENFYFKYKKKYNNLEEILKDKENFKNIFKEEFEEILKDLKEDEKEYILNKLGENLEEYIKIDLDEDNFFNLLFFQIPLFFLNKATNTLFLISHAAIANLHIDYIKKIEKELGIKLEKIEEKEYKNEIKKYKNIKLSIPNNNINIQKIIKENKKLKDENKKLKIENKKIKELSKKLIRELENLQININNLEQFIEKDVIDLVYTIINTKNLKQREKLKKELEQKIIYKPTASLSL